MKPSTASSAQLHWSVVFGSQLAQLHAQYAMYEGESGEGGVRVTLSAEDAMATLVKLLGVYFQAANERSP
jgi:hypothetical protein